MLFTAYIIDNQRVKKITQNNNFSKTQKYNTLINKMLFYQKKTDNFFDLQVLFYLQIFAMEIAQKRP